MVGGSSAGKQERKKKRRRSIVEKLKAGLRRKRDKQKQQQQEEEDDDRGEGDEEVVVVDGSDIRELVGNEVAFGAYVDHKFAELDIDRDGRLSVQELQPAVADIGAALGLPAQGSSPDSDAIYTEVLNEFTTHGSEQKEVSKTEFKQVLSDILLGMAAGLNRDPIVILRMDGEDLEEFADGSSLEAEMISIHSHILDSAHLTLRQCITTALQQLTVDHGMPPASDSWVKENIIVPALGSVPAEQLEQPANDQEIFLASVKKVVENIAQRLNEHPVIVAHSENTFDGSGINRLLSNKFELDKLLDTAWRSTPKDQNHKASKEDLRLALDEIAPSAGLPPSGAVDQVDVIINEAFRSVDADHGKPVHEEEFKKMVTEILGSIMLQLVGGPIFVSANSVVHEPLVSSSNPLVPPSLLPTQHPVSN